MPLLPRIHTREQYLNSPRDEATYAPAIREICRRHALPENRAAKYAGGSTIVFAVGEQHVVKLFEPIFAEAAAIEEAALAHVHGKLGVPTPGLVAVGELEGWRYIVMEQLAGTSLGATWDQIPEEERGSLCRRLGEALARQHSLPIEPLVLPGPEWADFLSRQAESCVERQRTQGLAEHWLAQIPCFLASVDLPVHERVLLHTEIMRDHVLVECEGEEWVVSGVFDYEPAMLGAPEYEFGSVGIFLSGGDPALFRAFLLGYGYTEADLTADLQRRILAHTLLHRYSNMKWYLETIPPKTAVALDELAAEWFAFA